MKNFITRLFMPHNTQHILNAAHHDNFRHGHTDWTETYIHGPYPIKYNRSSNKFTITNANMQIEASMEYSEKIERRLNPFDIDSRPVFYVLKVQNHDAPGQDIHEYDTKFAERIYNIIQQRYKKQQNAR